MAEKTTGAVGNIVAATGLGKKDEFPADMNVSPVQHCSQEDEIWSPINDLL